MPNRPEIAGAKTTETQPPTAITTTVGKEQPASFPVVGIGASAGGLRALQRFFTHTPADTGMAFVIITHLAPDHESHLSELLQPQTQMTVLQVTETTDMAPNHIYVIPPNRNLAAIDTHLWLTALEVERRHRAPIDQFFRTLARAYAAHAICVILSGTGADGSLGLRSVKEAGGLTVVQEPDDADYDGMPQSAIATGDAELVLPVEQIPARLVEYVHSQPQVKVPQEGEPLSEDERDLLQKILTQVSAQTGQDFSLYKSSTLMRRIRRRLQVHAIGRLNDYWQLLQASRGEVQALFHDFLITVTNFFRDPEAFEILEQQVIPRLFQGKGVDDQVRVWCAGCATGEEAYSLAILLVEQRRRLAAQGQAFPEIQIFASDLSNASLQYGREGLYPESVAADIAPERLQRFFTHEAGGYRVGQELREIVLFTQHNLLKDPPFSHLDLIACRNLLIYIKRSAQQQVLELLHYALRPTGYLWLSPAETIDSTRLFRALHKKLSIYQRQVTGQNETRLLALPLLPSLPRAARTVNVGEIHQSLDYETLHARLLEGFMPPSLLVNRDYTIVYFSANADRYLQQRRGEPTNHVLDRVHDAMRIELTAALYRAFEKGEATHSWPIIAKIDGAMRNLSFTVQPSPDPERNEFVLLLFHDSREVVTSAPSLQTDSEQGDLVRALEAELTATKQRLQMVIEAYEISQEEMKSANEELQSMNEELHSAAEELETGKEELQSVNEELSTINQENKSKIEELGQLTNDLQNLMASTNIATLFLDRELRIKRFTPRVSQLFNILNADRGRPLAHLTHKLGYQGLIDDATTVLRDLTPVEREINSEDGRCYLTRLLPYRTLDDRIDGIVITFVDITDRKQIEVALRQSEARNHALLGAVPDTILRLQSDGAILDAKASTSYQSLYTPEEMIGKNVRDLVPTEVATEYMRYLLLALETRSLQAYEYTLQQGEKLYTREARLAAVTHNEVTVMIRDVTARKAAEEERLRLLTEMTIQRSLTQRLAEIQEAERKEVARELHDQVGQNLTALGLNLKIIQEQLSLNAVDDGMQAAQLLQSRFADSFSLLEQITSAIRNIMTELRPPQLDDYGLLATLHWYGERISVRGGLSIEIHGNEPHPRLPERVENGIFRIAQEALTNVVKHARATRARVKVAATPDRMTVTITDNGRGFDLKNLTQTEALQHWGLLNMQERAAAAGGICYIRSRPGLGTSIRIEVPR